MEDQQEKPSLFVHEWLSIAVIIGFMGMLTLLSLKSNNSLVQVDHDHPHFISDPYIDVTVEGAVKNSGHLRVKRGSLVGEALKQAELLPEADLRRLNLNAKVRQNKVIKVPTLPMISINLEGAVGEEYKTVQMPKGSYLEDLMGKVKFKEGADLTKLAKKRRLKNGETIKIPMQS